jgi:hypothetical protein
VALTTKLGPSKHLASPDNPAAAASEQSCKWLWLGDDQLLSGLGSGATQEPREVIRICLLRTAPSFITTFYIRTFIALVYFLLIADRNIIFSTASGLFASRFDD